MQSEIKQKVILNHVILLLAEERTYYAMLRTGMAMFTFPLSLFALLIGTAPTNNLFSRPFVLASVVGILGAVLVLGIMQMRMAQKKLRRLKRKIDEIKHEHPDIAELII